MARRQTVNKTGIERLGTVDSSEVFVMYTCVNCGEVNIKSVGNSLLNPNEAYENSRWECAHCRYVHSKDSDLPEHWEKTWNPDYLLADSEQCQAFWKAFFRASTLTPEVYWKACNVCGRLLPYSAFDRHARWGALEM